MILDDIVKKKRERLNEAPYLFDIDYFLEQIQNIKTQSFRQALLKPELSIIGEIKKASPSRGLIKPDFDPVALAKEYDGAVDCISVLTEEDFFQGSPRYLKAVHETVCLPLLRKDFIISPQQILEAKELGASCVLLIVAILDPNTLKDYIRLAKGLHLDALVEVHSEEEVERALEAGADIVGINNRDLRDFSEDITQTIRLRERIPQGIVTVSESGIHTAEDIRVLRQAHIDGVLVGESFMRSGNIKEKARELKHAYQS